MLKALLMLQTISSQRLLADPHLSPHTLRKLAPGPLATAGALGAGSTTSCSTATAALTAGRFAVEKAGAERHSDCLRGSTAC